MLDIQWLLIDTCTWWHDYSTAVLLFDVYRKQCLYLLRHLLEASILFHTVFAVVTAYYETIIIRKHTCFPDSYSSSYYVGITMPVQPSQKMIPHFHFYSILFAIRLTRNITKTVWIYFQFEVLYSSPLMIN